MKNRSGNIFTGLAWLALFTLNLQPSTAHAQGTAFTYQGQLQNNGSPANGTYNLTLTLYTNASGGTIVAGPVTNNAVAVTNGLFTVTMDFGAGPWNGQTNWLQIAVKTNGGATFTMLTPLQELTPAPYAIYAESAGTATALAGGTALGSGSGNGIGLGNSDVFIGGGSQNSMSSSSYGFIGGGQNNFMTDSYDSFIGGGWDNFVSGDLATVGGGRNNTANNYYATVGGGWLNTAQGDLDTVGGGAGNFADGSASFIGGGGYDGSTYDGNIIQGNAASIVGGLGNFIYANYAFIGGGIGNTNNGMNGVIPGGYFNFASGSNSFAAGSYAQATNNGAFVWADNENAAFGSANANSFNVRANGGIQFVTGGAGMMVDGQSVLTNNAFLAQFTIGEFSAVLVSNANGTLDLNSANYNVGVGEDALEYNSGSDDVAIGEGAAMFGGVGNNNTAIGQFASRFSGGNNNTAVGGGALENAGLGNNNTAVGFEALELLGYNLPSGGTGGTNNIAVGSFAGAAFTGSESSNIDIGNAGTAGDSQTIRIGTPGIQSQTYIAGTISGNGGGLTNLNASQLTSIGNKNGAQNFFTGPSGNLTMSGTQNTGIGDGALTNNTSGGDDSAIGYEALFNNTGGVFDTANGAFALLDNVNGQQNLADGAAALEGNTSGSYNVANGYDALVANKTGSYNTADGYLALSSITGGTNNIALGDLAGQNLTGNNSSNIDIGNFGVAGDNNTIRIGSSQTQTYIAGIINGVGSGLTSLNAAQVVSTTAGTGNNFLGSAGNATTTGEYNTGSGLNALASNTSGSDNTTTGSGALHANTIGNDNTGYGYNALHANTNGIENTAVGSGALFNNISGTGNIAIGFNAGDNVTNNSNIDIGNIGSSSDNNIIRIGTSQASTYLVGNVYTPSGTVESSSDRNAKEDFSAVSPQSVLAKVASLPVTEWNYKTDKAVEHIGPMAQDFHAAFGLNGADDKHISVVDEGGVALAAIQGLNQKLEAGSTEQGVQIRNQNAEIQELKQQNDLLEKQLSELEATVKKLVAHE